jgi:8-oxo-dGTP diphosphatase
MAVITFGQKEDAKEYIKRPAVYCLMFNNLKDKIAIIEKTKNV